MKPESFVKSAIWNAVVLFVVLPFPVLAQTIAVDQFSLMARLERIERRLMALEQKLFAEGMTGATGSLAEYEIRLQEIENESTNLYGSVERLGHGVEALAGRMEKFAQDAEYRLQDLEGKSFDAPVSANKKEPVGPSALPEKIEAFKVPEGTTPEAHYKKAYDFLVAEAYSTAEKWLNSFVEMYPEHNLTENAFYWLGEVYLVQGKTENAIIAFKDGLTAFPEGPRASGNLLKMGDSFMKIGQKHHARSAWNKLMKDYPDSSEAAKARTRLMKREKAKDKSSETDPASSEDVQ